MHHLEVRACDAIEANVRVSPIDNFLVVPQTIAAKLTNVIPFYYFLTIASFSRKLSVVFLSLSINVA